MLKSPYLYFSVMFTAALYPFWDAEGDKFRPWSQVAIDTIPSMLGFSMGGMAIMLAFSNAKIFSIVTQDGKSDSFFMKVIANFFHFILVQTLAILAALLAKAYPNDAVSAFGCFAFVYAVLIGVATAGQLLRTAQIFNATPSLKDGKDD